MQQFFDLGLTDPTDEDPQISSQEVYLTLRFENWKLTRKMIIYFVTYFRCLWRIF